MSTSLPIALHDLPYLSHSSMSSRTVLNGDEAKHDTDKSRAQISIRERLKHFTWAWYTLTMSTGGLALLIANQPNRFRGLYEIGVIIYITNLVMFVMNTFLISTRFIMHGGFLSSLTHEREGPFFPTFWLSIATIIMGLEKYYGKDPTVSLTICMEALFWIYTGCTFILAVIQYSFVFSSVTYKLQSMMPSWILPAFPIMLSGTIASVIAGSQPSAAAIRIVAAGITFQGLGLSISFMMYAHYIGRLMESGLPSREHRPGMFICVGPPSFTALALIGMAQGLPPTFHVMGSEDTAADGRVLELLALAAGAFLWALSLWFFFIAAIAVLRSRPSSFHLNWWAMVFPNTGFTIATITLGNAFESAAIKGVGSALSICIICLWLFVIFNHIRAVIRQDIVYPGKDEDMSD